MTPTVNGGGNSPTLQLSFDPPPSVNRLYKRYAGRVILTPEARDYKQAVYFLALQQGARVIAGKVSVAIRFYGTRVDIDNGLKVLIDALNNVAWEDDKHIMHLEVDRYPDDKDDPRVEVEVWQP